MRAGLRDLRLLPAAVTAWLVSGGLTAGAGGAAVAEAAAVAALGWLVAAGAVAIAAVTLLRAGGEARGSREGRRGSAFLPAIAVAAAGAAWPATTVALGGGDFDPRPAWTEIAEPLRERFRRLAVGLPGGGGELLPGLAIGDDSGLDAGLLEAMRVTSLTHLTAVSGSNCALVVGLVMVGGALLRITRGIRILLALAALGAFVVLVTPQPSVVRAAVMAAFALVGLASSRPMQGLPLLCVAICGILGVSPAASTQLGFVLSVLATAGLLVLSGPLAALIGRILPRRLALALAVPVAAQLAVQPAIAIVQPELPTYGVLANLLAVPAAPAATVLGMLACLLAPLGEGLALPLAWLGWLPSQWIAGVATTLAGFPAARLPWPEGPAGILLHVLVLALGTAVLLARARWRRRAAALLLTGAVAYAGVVTGLGVAAGASRPSDWIVAMCDVGQGDATLVRSGEAIALVDAGPDRGALEACLRELGVERLALLVISHYDTDHVGGAAALRGRVDAVLTGPVDLDSERRVLAPLLAAGARRIDARAGDIGEIGGLGGHRWRVLWPPAVGTPEPGNAASLVWRLDPRTPGTGPSIAFLGDLGATEQARLLGRGHGGPATLVKVSHHGSADQESRLYAALRPRIALIGVGRGNDYGHPTAPTLAMLAAIGTTTARTDRDGLVLVAAEADGTLRLWRERAPGDVGAAE